MRSPAPRAHSLARPFITYAAITALPVMLFGLVLAGAYRTEAKQRGVSEGLSEARLVAETAVEPILDGRPLSQKLSETEVVALNRLVKRAVGDHNVLRMRLQDLSGHVVYSDDGSGISKVVDDEAVDAGHGQITADLTHLNSDSNDSGLLGPQAVEVYLPLTAGIPEHVVGVFEVYLPYAPIAADVDAGLRSSVPRPPHRPGGAVPGPVRHLGVDEPPPAPAGEGEQVPGRARPAHRAAQPVAVPPARPGSRPAGRREATRGPPSPSSTSTGSKRSTTRWATTAATSC